MAQYTSNYKLHQWEAKDPVLRTDFNEDFAKIDAAIQRVDAAKVGLGELAAVRTLAEAKCRIVSGSYTGNGTTQTVTLGARVKAVFIIYGMYTYMASEAHANFGLASEPGGFSITSSPNYNRDLNAAGVTFHYVAIL